MKHSPCFFTGEGLSTARSSSVVITIIASLGLGTIILLAHTDYRLMLSLESGVQPGAFDQTLPQNTVNDNAQLAADVYTLFGEATGKPGDSTDTAPLPETNLDLTLKGTFTHDNPAKASSLISAGGEPAKRIFTGQEVIAGAKLIEVGEGSVVLLRNGRNEILKLPFFTASDSSPQAIKAVSSTRATSAKSPTRHRNTARFTDDQQRTLLRERLEKLRSSNGK